MFTLERELVIHSEIVEKAPAAKKLWYYCRAMDTKGSGKVTLTMSQIEDVLNISRTTIWRYYSTKLLFPKTIKRGELLTLYYRGIIPLCIDLGINHWGTSTEINIEDLQKIKQFSTLAVTLSIQAKSKYLANISVKEKAAANSNRKRAVKGTYNPAINNNKLDSIFTSDHKSISEISPGIMKKEYGVLFVNDQWTGFGPSQSTIGKKINRSIRTVNRRLREVNKIKVAITDKQMAMEYNYYSFLDKEEYSNLSGRYFIEDGKVFRYTTSLYQPILSLTTKKKRLSKLKLEYTIGNPTKEDDL